MHFFDRISPSLNFRNCNPMSSPTNGGSRSAIRHRFNALDYLVARYLVVRDQKVESSNPVLPQLFCHSAHGRRSFDPVCRAVSCNACDDVPLLCHVSHSGQLRILNFLHRARSNFRAGWLPANPLMSVAILVDDSFRSVNGRSAIFFLPINR
jgi:hypothetical protein